MFIQRMHTKPKIRLIQNVLFIKQLALIKPSVNIMRLQQMHHMSQQYHLIHLNELKEENKL
jgi:hypothetical protein